VVEHGGQRVDVGAAVEHVAVQLLGRHVGERADTKDLRLVAAQVEHAAEVGDLDVDHLVSLQQREQVGGLDIAVDQALAEHITERHRALETDLDDLLQRQQRIRPAVAAQRDARHILHHEVGRDRVAHRVEQLHDVGVLQAADERGLGGEETLPRARLAAFGVGRQAGAHAFDRDLAVVEVVAGEEHLARRALAQLAQHAVAADVRGQRVGNGRSGGFQSGHGSLRIVVGVAASQAPNKPAKPASSGAKSRIRR
jgi:hypothetical protein